MKLLTFDTEGNGFVDTCDRLWCAAAKEHGGELVHWTFDDKYKIENFLDYLSRRDVLLGHNIIAHDLVLLRKLYGWTPLPHQKVVDTLLMSRLQNPDRKLPPHCPRGVAPHSVEAWGYRLGHRKVEHDEWDRFSPEMLERCKEDVAIQVQIYDALIEEGRGQGWAPAHRLNMQLFQWLQLQEEAGFMVDQPYMEACIAKLDRWINRIDRVVTPLLPVVVEIQEGKIRGEYGYVKKPFKADGSYSAVTERFLSRYAVDDDISYCDRDVSIGGPFSRIAFRYTNLDSNMEVKDFLLKQGWIPDQWNKNNAGQRTSPILSKDDPFVGIQGGLGKLVARRVQCRHRKSQIEGWQERIRPDGRISGIVSGLAVTGRARHKNIVNVPGKDAFFGKYMRRIFIAAPGKVLVGIDSVGNQIRQLAARMGDEDYKRMVTNPEVDMHQYHADRANIPIRHHAKTFFYALIFGAQDPKIARQLKIRVPEAHALRQKFLGGMPKLNALMKRLVKEWKRNNGKIMGLDGRWIKVSSEHQLLVYLLQSDEAIQMATAYVLFHERANEKWPYLQAWNTVLWQHDEIQVECIPSIARMVGELASEAIRESGELLGIQCPHEGSYKIGNNWHETH